jgi:hypothetical protein
MSKHRYYHDRITMALDDLHRCRQYCQIMLRLPSGEAFSNERTVYEALFVAFIISYGRVFTKSYTVDPTYKVEVSSDYRRFTANLVAEQEPKQKALHDRIMEKRHTAIAHSDAQSRNYQHYTDSPLAIGRNPYFPYDHEEVSWALELTNKLINVFFEEQARVEKKAFTKTLFGTPNSDT